MKQKRFVCCGRGWLTKQDNSLQGLRSSASDNVTSVESPPLTFLANCNFVVRHNHTNPRLKIVYYNAAAYDPVMFMLCQYDSSR